MRELRERVAVVTGAARVGRALALRFAHEGMRVVVADVELPALAECAAALAEQGARAESVEADVSRAEDVERLARAAFDAFGGSHVLCNNAGVWGNTSGAYLWENTLRDWEWTLGVNLWSVVHGIRAFLPRMVERGATATS